MQYKNNYILKLELVVSVLLLGLMIFPTIGFSQIDSSVKKLGLDKQPYLKYTPAARDPFHPQVFIYEEPELEEPGAIEEVRIQEALVEYKPKPSELFSFSVQGIIWDSDIPMAIIDNGVFQKGSIIHREISAGEIAKITIVDINKEGVMIAYGGEAERLPLASDSESQKKQGGIDEYGQIHLPFENP